MGRREVCELTPGGRGAICVLEIRSDRALDDLNHFFQASSGHPLDEIPLMKPAYGLWTAHPDGIGEDVVVVRRSDFCIEVHCHGGEFAKKQILAGLTAKGFRTGTWLQWPGDSGDEALENDARILLARTTTPKTAAVLNWQVNGAFRRALQQLAGLIGSEQTAMAASCLDRLSGWRNFSAHLVAPWQVAIAGLPNVGKSSLMNRIAGFERSIVFDLPGTTRDAISATTALNGLPFEFTDTAGLRESDDPIEQAGTGLSRKVMGSADLILLVEDITRPHELDIGKIIPPEWTVPLVRAANKADLAGERTGSTGSGHFATSAMTGAGIQELLHEIYRRLVPQEPVYQEAVPWRSWQFDVLDRIRTCIQTGETAEALRLCNPSAFVKQNRGPAPSG